MNAEPGTPNAERDTDMTATYIRVIVLEAATIVALWLLSRAFS